MGGMGGSAPQNYAKRPGSRFPRTRVARSGAADRYWSGEGVLQHRPAGSMGFPIVIQLFSLRPAIRFVSLGGTGEPDHRP